jgi:hypothetical protein
VSTVTSSPASAHERAELEAEELVGRRGRGIDEIRALTCRYPLSAPPEELVRAERQR